ncbi:MAG: ABC transporter substrate-binding protein, partial [Campylobacter sp.]|nr:ABC transporter substrate-binding protein [Campylobacter sp.]
ALALMCLVGIGNAENLELDSKNSKGEAIKVSVPKDPKRIAVLDPAMLDMIDAMGLGDRIVALTPLKIDYLAKYNDKKELNVGTAKEVDLEKIMVAKPDLILVGHRLVKQYDDIAKIAPAVMTGGIDYKLGAVKSIRKNITDIASIFDKQDEVGKILDGYEKRIAAIKEKVGGKTAIIGLVTKSSFNTLGNERKCAIITTDMGFDNVAKNSKSEHGSESSFELLVKLNPEYVFVLDRDNAIGTAGAKTANEVMDNELVKKTDAFKNGKMFYLTPAVWYLTEGGITAYDMMLKDIENALK